MRKLLPAAVLCLVFSTPALAQNTPAAGVVEIKQPGTSQNAHEAFVDSLTQKVLGTLKSPALSFQQKKTQLGELFDANVDAEWIARFVAGKNWRTATPDQQANYLALYKRYLTTSYVNKFDEKAGDDVKAIKVLAVKELGNSQFSVNTDIEQKDGEPVHVDYRLRDNGGNSRIIDISVEGVSLLTTHRSEFASIAANGGLQAIINRMQQTMAKPPVS